MFISRKIVDGGRWSRSRLSAVVTEVGFLATGGVASLGCASGQGKKKRASGGRHCRAKSKWGFALEAATATYQGNEVTGVAWIGHSIPSHRGLA